MESTKQDTLAIYVNWHIICIVEIGRDVGLSSSSSMHCVLVNNAIAMIADPS